MSIYSSPVEVINAALSRMGTRAIESLDEQSKPSIVANAMYEGVVNDLFSRHAWTFATKEEPLVYQGTNDGQYGFAFTAPSDFLSIKAVVDTSGALVDYAVRDNKILTNHSSGLLVRYAARIEEGRWPGDFAEAVVTRLQAEFFRALREEEAVAQSLERAAEAKFTRAMVRDKRQQSDQQQRYIGGAGHLVRAWSGGV